MKNMYSPDPVYSCLTVWQGQVEIQTWRCLGSEWLLKYSAMMLYLVVVGIILLCCDALFWIVLFFSITIWSMHVKNWFKMYRIFKLFLNPQSVKRPTIGRNGCLCGVTADAPSNITYLDKVLVKWRTWNLTKLKQPAYFNKGIKWLLELLSVWEVFVDWNHNNLISSQEHLTLIFVDFIARSRLILDINMSDPGAGPSNISSQKDPRTIPRPNGIELFNPDESGSDNDFKQATY